MRSHQILINSSTNYSFRQKNHQFGHSGNWTLLSPGFTLFACLFLWIFTGLFIMPTRYDILDHVFAQGSSPAQENFKDLCIEWIKLNFPLVKDEDLERFLKNFCVQSKGKWEECRRIKKTFYEGKKYKSYFGIEVHFPQDQPPMEVDLPHEIDLSSPKQFAQFVCPVDGCGFMNKSDVKFKKHVIAKHPFVAGKNFDFVRI